MGNLGSLLERLSVISIVVPVWNEETRLDKCLKSIRQQDYTDFEVIMVNDCSTDLSKEIMLRYTKDRRFKYFENSSNRGTGFSLNKGFKLCSGDLVTWFSGDSWMYPNFLSSLKEEIGDHILAYSNWDQVDQNGKVIQNHVVPEYNKSLLQKYSYIGPCALYKKEYLDKILPICEQICEDYYMWLSLSHHGDFIKIDKTLGVWRDHKDNLTNRINNPSGWYLSAVAKAKARWNLTKYRVAYLCPNLDAANVGWFHFTCFNDLSQDYSIRHILGDKTHLTLGTDISLKDPDYYSEECLQTLREADIVHINNEYPDYDSEIYDIIKDKALIVHMHAGPKQWNWARMAYWNKSAKVISCTPGLINWMPNILPVGPDLTYSEYYKPVQTYNAKPKLLCHHNYLAGKGILQLQEAIESFNQTTLNLKEVMDYSIQAQKFPLLQHLQLKKTYDIVIDTLTHGYCGMASWESMCHGRMVMCRLDHETQEEYLNFFGSVPPITNLRLIDDVFGNLLKVLQDKKLIKEYGMANRKWIDKNYRADQLLKRYENIYEESLRDCARLRKCRV